MQLQIKKVNPNAIIPTRNNPADSGLDLYACLDKDVVIDPSMDQIHYANVTWDFRDNINYQTKVVEDIETNNPSVIIPTGIAIKLPDPEQYLVARKRKLNDDVTKEVYYSSKSEYLNIAYEAQIRPISIQGLLVHWGTYHLPHTGEIKVCLYNLTNKPIVIKHGMRIAQLVIAPVFLPDLIESDFDVNGINGFDK